MTTQKEITLRNFIEWKEEQDKLKTIPRGLNRKEERKLIEDLYLVKDSKGDLIISGGGRIMLWTVYVEGGWKKYIRNIEKKRWWGHYLEILKFRHRERLYNVNLIKHFNKSNKDVLLDDAYSLRELEKEVKPLLT